MAETKIKKSQNFLQMSGTLLETNLEILEGKKFEIMNFKGDGSKKEVTGSIARKKEVKNPALLIECSPRDEKGNIIGTYQLGVDFKFNWDANSKSFIIASKEFDKDGKVVDSGNFKGIETVIDEYITRKDAMEKTANNKKIAEKKANGEEVVTGVDYDVVEPTRVFVKSGFLSPNEYVSKEGEYKVYLPTITTYNVTSTGVPENDICEGNITGYIRTIKDEVKGEDAEETGRLKVEFYFFDNKGEAYPIQFTVEEDLADATREIYSNGDSCKLYYEVLTRQVGAKKVAPSGGMGRRETNTTSGYTALEYSIFRGDPAFEEEHDLYIEPKDFKKAMQSREITIEQKIKDKKDKSGSSTKSSGAKSGGLGSRASKIEQSQVDDDDLDELPFD